jgi:malate synthase
MEDAATAEISRSQIWQWRHNRVTLDTGETVTTELVERIVDEEIHKLDQYLRYQSARALFLEVALADEYVDFLTLPAYERFD